MRGATLQRMLQPALTVRARLDWLAWLSALLVVVLFVGGKVGERLILGRHWHSFGRLDLAELVALALAVGTFTWYVHRRMQRDLALVEEQCRRAEVAAAENAAVVRAVSAVVRELAQPLSGAMGYSELLALRAGDLSAHEQYEVRCLREGVLRLEDLLQSVRDTLARAPASQGYPHLAEAVEDSVTPARLKLRHHDV
jgi:signal transduction histidine kinase